MGDIWKSRNQQRAIGDQSPGAEPIKPPRASRTKETEQALAKMSKPFDGIRQAGINTLALRKAARTENSEIPQEKIETESPFNLIEVAPGNVDLFASSFPPLTQRGPGRPKKIIDPNNPPPKPIRKKVKKYHPRDDLVTTMVDASNAQASVTAIENPPLLTALVAPPLQPIAVEVPRQAEQPGAAERKMWIGSDEKSHYEWPFTFSYSATECRVNDVLFVKDPNINYKYDYCEIARQVCAGEISERKAWMPVFRDDLWAIAYFILKVAPLANHSFVVNYAREIEEGPRSETLDLVAREHFKSTLLTQAETIKDILNDPEERICILSYASTAAQSFLRAIKYILESDTFLHKLYSETLYKNPKKESARWSELGFIVKRKGNYKEMTLEAYGLEQGMPTGKHYTKIVYDDIVTADMAFSPIAMERCKEKFDLSVNLGTFEGRSRVIGTFYHYNDPLTYIQRKKDSDGNSMYWVRKKPATVDGTFHGAPVFLPQRRLDLLRSGDRQAFNSQQLLDPSPVGARKLDSSFLVEIDAKDIPGNLIKLMTVDPAGADTKATSSNRDPDSWASGVLAVDPNLVEGFWNVYVIDLFVEQCTLTQALEQIVYMYTRNGYIKKLGVEKVGQSTFELHVANALKARGKRVTLESGNLAILTPAGRSKEYRIERALEPPLRQKRLHISRKIPVGYRDRLREELDRFPMWHDDVLDLIAYGYDLMRGINFNVPHGEAIEAENKQAAKKSMFDYGRRRRQNRIGSWMTAG